MLSVVSSLFGSASKLVGIGVPCDDGFVDRLNHNWTTFLLTFFCLAVTTNQFAGHPIHCAINKDHEQWKDYITSICWIKNTYNVPFEEILPPGEVERRQREIKYYQWVPIILLLQALMFKFPNMVWKMLNGSAGLNIQKITSLAESTQYDTAEKRSETIGNIAAYIHSWLLFERERHYTIYARMRHRMSRLSILFFPIGYRNGTYLVGLYCFSKWLYIINIICQFYILDSLLDFPFSTYGYETLYGLIETGVIQESESFPKVTYCDIQIRQQANLNTYTFMCVLSINMLSERLFAIMWFWFVFLAIANIVSTIKWGYNLVFRRNRARYVEKYLSRFVDVAQEQELCQKFVDDYLRDDGVLILRAVANNSSIMVLADLVEELWRTFLKHQEVRQERKEKRMQELKNRDKMEMEVIADDKGNTSTHLRKQAL